MRVSRRIILTLIVGCLLTWAGTVVLAQEGEATAVPDAEATATSDAEAPATPEGDEATTSDAGTPTTPEEGAATETTPQTCASCHLDSALEWQGSPHATTFHEESFQTSWLDQRSNPLCLSCHTTGFVPRTAEFDHAGVTCEACHGETPVNHPPETMPVELDSTVCADCHTSTYAEWERSGHGVEGVVCADCHDAHRATIKAESSEALCLSCHESAPDTYAHVTHPEQACVECHYHTPSSDAMTVHITTGALPPTGHQGDVFTVACVNCHGDMAAEGADAAVSESASVVLERPAVTATGREQPQGPDFLLGISPRLIEGLLVGLGLGVTLVTIGLQIRARRRRH